MSTIEVNPDQVTEVGAALVQIADRLAQVGDPLSGLGLAHPPLTGAALGSLSSSWPVGVERLAGDVRSLGNAARGAAFLYTMNEKQIIPVTPP